MSSPSIPTSPPNLLREDLPLPAAVVYQSRLTNNLRWMQEFADRHGVLLAPHGKTTMTPDFFRQQLQAGAWALTLASAPQVAAAYHAGARRIIMANQLVGRGNMRLICELLETSRQGEPLDFYCLVDSPDNVRQLGQFISGRGQTLQLLLEIGVHGCRCGCRTREQIDALCAAIADYPALKLAGVETYEGVIHGDSAKDTEQRIREHLAQVRETCIDLLQESRFDTEQVILTGAGSAWYDLVAEAFTNHSSEARLRPVIRPGCYLIHDCGIYMEAQQQVMTRLGKDCPTGNLQSSLEVWAYVQSCPEPGLAILGLGKRDSAFDAGLPQPALHHRPGTDGPRPAPAEWRSVKIMDQHCLVEVPTDADLLVGDIVALSTSHPCLTFDKWRQIQVIDDRYNVLRQVETCF